MNSIERRINRSVERVREGQARPRRVVWTFPGHDPFEQQKTRQPTGRSIAGSGSLSRGGTDEKPDRPYMLVDPICRFTSLLEALSECLETPADDLQAH